MPIYEYTCECGARSEHLVRNASQTPTCPECGSSQLTRLFSTFAAHGGETTPSCGQTACPSASACEGNNCGCPFS